MSNIETDDRTLPEHEQAILDTALLESDQLLARSLHDDQRRRQRRRWLSVTVFGGVVMCSVLMAIWMGWVSLGQVQAPSDGNVTNEQTAQAKQEDLALQKRMLAATNADRWDVGAKIGMDLVRIPGDRPYKLLASNWKKIAVDVRKQILKGFTPGMMGNKKMHSRFFDVMDLGMSDKDPEVRSFAANYLKMQGLPDYEKDLVGYKRWRAKTEKLSADETMKLVKANPAAENTEASDFQRAWKYFFNRKYTTSERLFRRVLESEPKNPHAMNGLGWSLLNQDKVPEAKEWLQKSIKLEPEHWGAISGLAFAHQKEGKIDEAVKLYERVVENSKGPNDATAALADIYMERKEYRKAIANYEKLIQWHPDNKKAIQKELDKAKAALAAQTD